MGEENEDNSSKNLGDPPKPIDPVDNQKVDTSGDHKQTGDEEAKSEAVKKEAQNITVNVPPLVVNIPPQDNKAANRANVIAIVSILVNAGMLLATYSLLLVASEQTTAANKSAQAAIDAVKQSKIDNQRTYDFSKASFDSSLKSGKDASDVAKQNVALQDKSVTQQILSLQETQKQFLIENRPFVAITNISIDTTFTNNAILCKWDFVNVGRLPAKIMKVSSRLAFGLDTTSKFLIKAFEITQTLNQYIAGGISLPWNMYAYFEKNTAQLVKAYIRNGKVNLYFIGYYTYYNPTLKTYYNENFFVEIKYDEFMKVSFLKNKETQYKTKKLLNEE